jgi:hypothetical protein
MSFVKKALLIYYSQTGQAKEIADTIIKPLRSDFDFVFEELKPIPSYPFPWTGLSFFQTFPESVQEIHCQLEPFTFDPDDNYDLVILAFQVWYLSPSIPIISFLQSAEAKKVMKDKPVITIQGVRNMWVMSQERIKKRIWEAGGNLVGNIVLTDKNPNLISVITIVKWMTTANKQGKGFYAKIFPPAGVAIQDIQGSEKYGEIILKTFQEEDLNKLQDRLLAEGAIKINPVLVSIEKRGLMMFKIWSKFIIKKGAYNSLKRTGRLKLFKYYLFAVIYLISPLASFIFYLFHKINIRGTRNMTDYYSHNKFKE